MVLKNKLILLATLTAAATLITFLLPPVAQPEAYHHFADTRPLWGVPNFLNVFTNLPFVIVGIVGIYRVTQVRVQLGIHATYFILFSGVLLTGVGSGYYHWHPNNDSLVWDRIPLTIVFMSLLSATISEVWAYKIGIILLLPLVIFGIVSVLWWHFTEMHGNGDLRPYLLVQFYPVVFIPLLLWLFHRPERKSALQALAWVVVWYVVAKVFELTDHFFYDTLSMSGHSLKHLAAAVSTWYFVLLFNRLYCQKST